MFSELFFQLLAFVTFDLHQHLNHQLIPDSQWTFVSNLMKLPLGVPEIWRGKRGRYCREDQREKWEEGEWRWREKTRGAEKRGDEMRDKGGQEWWRHTPLISCHGSLEGHLMPTTPHPPLSLCASFCGTTCSLCRYFHVEDLQHHHCFKAVWSQSLQFMLLS